MFRCSYCAVSAGSEPFISSTAQEMRVADILVTKHEKGKNTYGNCKYCNNEVEWRLKRALNHASKCHDCPKPVQNELRAVQSSQKRQKTVFLSSECSSSTFDIDERSSNTTSAYSLNRWVDSMNAEHATSLDLLIAKFFYRTGIPFNAADCDEWRDLWKYARPSYSPPSSKKLRTSLLDKTNEIMRRECQEAIDDAHVVTLVTDG